MKDGSQGCGCLLLPAAILVLMGPPGWVILGFIACVAMLNDSRRGPE